jgi:hypothetical protein
MSALAAYTTVALVLIMFVHEIFLLPPFNIHCMLTFITSIHALSLLYFYFPEGYIFWSLHDVHKPYIFQTSAFFASVVSGNKHHELCILFIAGDEK